MQESFQPCLSFVLSMEGGFADMPNDPGGATMEGVTLAVYRAFKGDNSLTADDLKEISPDDVSTLYRQNYWNKVHGDTLPAGVDLSVTDMAINAGVNSSAKLLQAALKVDIDGDLGPQTLSAVASADPVSLINSLAQHQGNYYRSLSTFNYFGKGWMRRVSARQAAALKLASDCQPAPQNVRRTSEVPPDEFWASLKAEA